MIIYCKSMDFIRKNNKLLQNLLLIGSFIVLITFMWFRMDNLLDSDISTQLVLSKFLRDEHSFLSTNWFYATELHVLGYNLIYEPLFFICSNWKLVRFFGQVILYIILLLSIRYFCKNLKLMDYYGIIGTAFIIPYSEQYFLYVLKNINYIPFLAISFISIGIMFDYYYTEIKLKKIILIIIMSLLSFGAGLGGSRQLYITYAPMFLATCIYTILKQKKLSIEIINSIKTSKEFPICVIVFDGLLCNMLGYIVNNKVLSNFYDFLSFDKISWTGFQIDKFSQMISGIFQNLGMSSEKVFSFGAFHTIICLILVMVSVFIFVQVIKHKKNIQFELLLLALFILSSIFISFILYCFTTQLYAARYDLFWTVFIYPFIIMFFKKTDFEFRNVLLTIIIIGIGLCSLDSYKNYSDLDYTSELKNIVTYLNEEGYSNGYATFWQANILTELSNGEIEMWDWNGGSDISNVDTVYRWAQDKQHEYVHPEGKVFWVLTEDESLLYYLPKTVNDDFIVYRTDEDINDGILDTSKRKLKYVVYGFNSYEEMYNCVGGYIFGNEKIIQRERSVKSDSGITLYPDTYTMICIGENLNKCKIDLTYKKTVKYQHSYVLEDNRTDIDINYIKQEDDYIIVEFDINELATDVIAEFTNETKSYIKISSIEFNKTYGYYSDFYRNTYVYNGIDSHGKRLLEDGGISYGPYKTLIPGTYIVECKGEKLDLLTFDCVYTSVADNNISSTIQIEINDIYQDDDSIYYKFECDEIINNMEARFYNNSGQEVILNSLVVKRIGEENEN